MNMLDDFKEIGIVEGRIARVRKGLIIQHMVAVQQGVIQNIPEFWIACCLKEGPDQSCQRLELDMVAGLHMIFSAGWISWSAYNQLLTELVMLEMSMILRSTEWVRNQTFDRQ